MLKLGTLPSKNIRNVCNLSELNGAKFERKLMLTIHVESSNWLIFGFVARKALKYAELSFRSIKSDWK